MRSHRDRATLSFGLRRGRATFSLHTEESGNYRDFQIDGLALVRMITR